MVLTCCHASVTEVPHRAERRGSVPRQPDPGTRFPNPLTQGDSGLEQLNTPLARLLKKLAGERIGDPAHSAGPGQKGRVIGPAGRSSMHAVRVAIVHTTPCAEREKDQRDPTARSLPAGVSGCAQIRAGAFSVYRMTKLQTHTEWRHATSDVSERFSGKRSRHRTTRSGGTPCVAPDPTRHRAP